MLIAFGPRFTSIWCLALTLAFSSPARPQTAAATVNGDSITDDEIDQRTRLDFITTHKESARQNVINQLADDKDKIREAEKSGIDLADAKVDITYAQMCARMRTTPEQLTKSLEGNGIRLATLKQRLKADMARASLARLRYYRYQDRPLGR